MTGTEKQYVILCMYRGAAKRNTVRGEILEGQNIGEFGESQLIRQKLTHQNFAFEIHACAIINQLSARQGCMIW